MKRDQQSECGICGSQEGLLLHNIRHRGNYRRLCTNCILKSHQGLFCPICLHVFDDSPPPPHARLMCSKCPSICHLTCSSSSSADGTVTTSFVCPPCSNPSFVFFNVNYKKIKVNGNGDVTANNNYNNNNHANVVNQRSMDVGSARALVAAAKIAAASMSKAAALARAEAERRVKEATLAKKRAREALERLMNLAADEKERELKKKSSNGVHSVSAVAAVAGPLQQQHQDSKHGVGN